MNLPAPGAPLVLADGTMINPVNGSVVVPESIKTVEVPTNSEAVDIVVKTRRKLSDLPETPGRMNIVSLVLVYTLFGLTDRDIAIATSLSEDQIKRIRQNEIYSEFKQRLLSDIKDAEQDAVRRVIADKAVNAVHKVAGLVDSDDDKIALAASKDILDRANYRPADVREVNLNMSETLRIEFIHKSPLPDPTDVPIDGDFEDIPNG